MENAELIMKNGLSETLLEAIADREILQYTFSRIH